MEDTIKEGDNSEWLEMVMADFQQCLAEGHYVHCQDIITAVRGEGFESEAYELHGLLQEEKVLNFK
jgi:hypothetical protein